MRTRFLSLMLFLLTSIAAGAADLVLAGQSYTLGNSTWFLTGDPAKPISTGTVRWDASTKTLTLDNVFIPQADGAGAVGLEINKSDFSRITIELKGFNRVLTTSYSAFRLGSPVTIKGDGSLTVGSSSKHAVEFIGKNVELRLEAPLNITMAGGITANTDKTCGIAVREGGELNFNQSANRKMAIEKLSYINLSDEFGYLKPRGAYMSISGNLCNKDKNYVTGEEVRIAKAEYYGLKIGGTKVTSANYDLMDNWQFYNKNVKMTGVSFDPSSRTLNFNNATITTVRDGFPVIENDEEITINCSGNNRFVYESAANNNLGLKARAHLTLTGGGTLDMTNGSDYTKGGIFINKHNADGSYRTIIFYNYVNLKTPRVYSETETGGARMSCRDKWEYPTQTGTLTATGHPDGTFKGLVMGTVKNIIENDGHGYSWYSTEFNNRLPFKTYAKKAPTYQYANSNIVGVVDQYKQYVTGLVEYDGNQTIYPIEIAGYPVTSSNMDNIANRCIKFPKSNSKLSYVPGSTTNTLNISDVFIDPEDIENNVGPGISYKDYSRSLEIHYKGGEKSYSGDNRNWIICQGDREGIVSVSDLTFTQDSSNDYFVVEAKNATSEKCGLIRVAKKLTLDEVSHFNAYAVEAADMAIKKSLMQINGHLGQWDSRKKGYYQKCDWQESIYSVIDTNYGRAYFDGATETIWSKGELRFVPWDDFNEEIYFISVCGTQITQYNCRDVVNEATFNCGGKIMYEPSNKTLRLSDVDISYYNGTSSAIYIYEKDVTIDFWGKNLINSYSAPGIEISSPGCVIKCSRNLSKETYYLNVGGTGGIHLTAHPDGRQHGSFKYEGIKNTTDNTHGDVMFSADCIIDDDQNSSTNDVTILDVPVWISPASYQKNINVDHLYANDFDIVDQNNKLCTVSGGHVVDSEGKTVSGQLRFLPKGTVVRPVTGITLNRTSYTFTALKQEITLKATVTPDDATNKTVTWESDKPEVATVDNNGKVQPVENGSATITAKAGSKTATCQVTVAFTKPTGIKVDPSSLTIDPTDMSSEYEVACYFDNEGSVSDTRVDWTIEGSNAVEIVSTYEDYTREAIVDGREYVGPYRVAVVKAAASPTGGPTEGTCKLVATTPNGGPRGECVITLHQPVLAQRVVLIDKNGTSLDKVNIAGPGRYQNVTAKVYPENAENVTFQIVGNVTAGGVNSVAQMNRKDQGQPNEFTIVGIGEGYTRLGVYVKNGDAVLCSTFVDVTVKTPVPVEFVSVSIPEGDNKIMGIGNTLQLEAEIYPESADTLEVTWKSDDPSVATVDADGLVTAKSYGECNIIATSVAPGKKSGSEHIYVVDPDNYIIVPATGIALDRTAATSVPYGRVELEAILTPADANEYIEWHLYDSTGNEAGNCSYVSWLAPRDSRKCTVEAFSTGTYTVVANVKDRNNVLATCRLTVRDEQIFYVQNAEGITVCYRETKIDDPENMQCEVFGNESDPAVPDGMSGKLVIPSQVTYNGNTYNVKHITDEAFKRCNYLTEVVVSEGIETIGARAFMFDETTWAMPGEFFYANLQTVTLPASLKGLGEDCFTGQYSLTTVYMNCEEQPGSVSWGSSTVDDQMIYGAHPFDMINGEATLYVPDGALDTYYGLDIDKPWKNWFSHIEEMGSHNCYMYFTEETVEGVEITYFCTNSASKKCVVQNKNNWSIIEAAVEVDPELRNASEITVPEKVRGGEFTVVGIGINAFNRVEGVYTIRLPKSIQTIGVDAFRDCSSLSHLYVKTDVPPTFLGWDGEVLYDSEAYGIFDVIDENAVLHVPFGCARHWWYDPWPMWFKGGVVEEDTYFAEETAEGDDVSYRVTNEDEMTCEVKADPNVSSTAVASDVTEVVIPEMVDDYVVVGIAADAFQSHTSLTKVTLPATTEYIGQGAFQMCTKLTDVTILAEEAPALLDSDGMPVLDNYAFSGIATSFARSFDKSALSDDMPDATLHVPYGCRDSYAKTPWTDWFSRIVDDATKPVGDPADVNGDGSVDVADIANIIDIMAGIDSPYAKTADVNGDGSVDVADIATIIDRMAELARQLRASLME